MSMFSPSGSQAALIARRRTFRALHERGCFVIPNPWDVGSARYLQHLGFPALATTSAGFAFSQGRPDSDDDSVVGRDRSLAHIANITAAVELPVNADFMSGYGLEPDDVAESVARCVATGVAGLSIEDTTGDRTSPLYELPIALERLRAARQAIDESGDEVLLTARAECYLVRHPDPFRESLRRLQAYAAAGADVLFAPGVQSPAEIKALVEAVAPKPLNLLVIRDIGLSVDEIAALGVRRISVGGALALAAWTGFVRAAQTLRSKGSFAGLASLVSYAEINGLFETRVAAHHGVEDYCGRSESLDSDDVGDIADEGVGLTSGGCCHSADPRPVHARRASHCRCNRLSHHTQRGHRYEARHRRPRKTDARPSSVSVLTPVSHWPRRIVRDFASHIYFPAELELLCLSAGFQIAQQYGDYRFVPFGRTSPYVWTVAHRPRRSGWRRMRTRFDGLRRENCA